MEEQPWDSGITDMQSVRTHETTQDSTAKPRENDEKYYKAGDKPVFWATDEQQKTAAMSHRSGVSYSEILKGIREAAVLLHSFTQNLHTLPWNKQHKNVLSSAYHEMWKQACETYNDFEKSVRVGETLPDSALRNIVKLLAATDTKPESSWSPTVPYNARGIYYKALLDLEHNTRVLREGADKQGVEGRVLNELRQHTRQLGTWATDVTEQVNLINENKMLIRQQEATGMEREVALTAEAEIETLNSLTTRMRSEAERIHYGQQTANDIDAIVTLTKTLSLIQNYLDPIGTLLIHTWEQAAKNVSSAYADMYETQISDMRRVLTKYDNYILKVDIDVNNSAEVMNVDESSEQDDDNELPSCRPQY